MTPHEHERDLVHAAFDAAVHACHAAAYGDEEKASNLVNAFVNHHGLPGFTHMVQVWAACIHHLKRPADTPPPIPTSTADMRTIMIETGYTTEAALPNDMQLAAQLSLMEQAQTNAQHFIAIIGRDQAPATERENIRRHLEELMELDNKTTLSHTCMYLMSEAAHRMNTIDNDNPDTTPGFTAWCAHLHR